MHWSKNLFLVIACCMILPSNGMNESENVKRHQFNDQFMSRQNIGRLSLCNFAVEVTADARGTIQIVKTCSAVPKTTTEATTKATTRAPPKITYICSGTNDPITLTVNTTGTGKEILLYGSSVNVLNISSTTQDKYVITKVKKNTPVLLGVVPKTDGEGTSKIRGGKNFEVHSIKCVGLKSGGVSRTVFYNGTVIKSSVTPKVEPDQTPTVTLTLTINEINAQGVVVPGNGLQTVSIGTDVMLVIKETSGLPVHLKPESCVAIPNGQQTGQQTISNMPLLKTGGCSKSKSFLDEFVFGTNKLTARLHPFRFVGYPAVTFKCSVLVCDPTDTTCDKPKCQAKKRKRSVRNIGHILTNKATARKMDVSASVSVQDEFQTGSSSGSTVSPTGTVFATFSLLVLSRLH